MAPMSPTNSLRTFSIRRTRTITNKTNPEIPTIGPVLERKRTPSATELCYQRLTQSIDRVMVLTALEEMSRYMSRHNCQVRLVALEGVVDTLFLNSWTSTTFGFIICEHLPDPLLGLLKEARAQVIARSPFLMDTQWFDLEKLYWMPEKTAKELTAEAFRQNDVVFDGTGLKIFAAPWEYAFTIKCSRLFIKGARNPRAYYDLYDAVQYLRQCILKGTRQQIGLDTVSTWAKAFGLQIGKRILIEVINPEYVKQFGVGAFCHSRDEAVDATRWDELTLHRTKPVFGSG